jgi:CHAT domain-containing protein
MSRPSEQISGAGARIRQDQDGLEQRIRDAERQLSSKFPRFAELSIPKPLPASELARLLDPDDAVVSLAVGTNHSFMWAWRAGKFDFIALDINAEQLGAEVDALRSSLDPTRNRTLEPFDVNRSFSLYARTIGRASAVVDGSKELIFVPDGALQSLPISVLVTSKPPPAPGMAPDYRKVDWLIRHFAFTVSPSISSISTLRNPPGQVSPDLSFIGIGDPVLKGPPASKGPADPRTSLANLFRGPLGNVQAISELEPLPETAVELRGLAQSQGVGDDHLYLQERASEPVVRAANLAAYRTIAFATHGLVGGELRGLAEPALVLTPPEKPSDDNDGLLSATEIAQLTLSADWVILSACNTAAGTTLRAEGLSGLAKSFIYAGARALLVSHWKVLSDKAVNLSVGTLGALSRNPNISKAQALRQAELSLIDSPSAETQSSHPLFWAPFVVVGTSRQ